MPPRAASSIARIDETRRLELILEAVRYCQRVKAMGMPVNAYTKALREPVYFLWERRTGVGKAAGPKYRSKAAVGKRYGKGEIVYDHAIPFAYLQSDLLALDNPTPESVRNVLNRYGVVALITRRENARLARAGLSRRMPEGWDRTDPLARYRAVGIELVENA